MRLIRCRYNYREYYRRIYVIREGLDCPHAGGHAKGSQDGCQDSDSRLNDVFPSIFVHNFEV